MGEGPFPHLAQAYRALVAALDTIPNPTDRRVARDALRDALDRTQEMLDGHGHAVIADTFLVDQTLHQGNAFVVLKLRHRDLGTAHALKSLREDRRHEPILRDLLQREARHQLQLAHPAILPIRALLRLPDGRPGILMDYVKGPSLADRLFEETLMEPQAARLAARLCEALAAVHAANLLHLDLSPANIVLPGGKLEDALLADFGLSLAIGECHRDRELTQAQSHHFASPEQAAGAVPLDARADLFALGRVIRACLPPDASGPLAAWADHLATPDRAARFPSIAEARAALDALHFGEPLEI
ncbi:serine/threonine protein kinase [Mesorhizobium sp. RP14(2022)]|uniref:Serine/threonine protein kinase n=1 Tax=Mesorhizobium liriopis TaxID=2953882 RepID=A0ABT1CAB1_9HYPH|nr:serine/threonine-protein kinase [Mesorhizobium liriopis]MCO6051767.1 serine/threonine protein kinase [Mesorhizobium liriopis]